MALKVDFHTHILPKDWPQLKQRYGYGGWIQMDHSCGRSQARIMRDGKLFRVVEPNCWSPPERVSDMDRSGVNVQVISTVPVMFNYWAKPEDTLDLCQILNNHIASVVADHPRRFVGMGTLPLQSPLLAVEELKRCVSILGFPGMQIGSHVNDWNLDCRALDPVYKVAEELDCSLFVHPWDMEQEGRMSKYWLPWLVGMPAETTTAMCSVIFGGVLERFPNLKICFAHGGGAFPYTYGRIQHGFEVRPDLCATENQVSPNHYLGKLYADSLVHSEDSLRLLIKVLGEDQVLLGSDYPFPLGERDPGKLMEGMADIEEGTKIKIQGINAMKFLGINISDYV